MERSTWAQRRCVYQGAKLNPSGKETEVVAKQVFKMLNVCASSGSHKPFFLHYVKVKFEVTW